MPKYLIYENEIGGLAGDLTPETLPSGDWQIVESELDGNINQLFWDGTSIKNKPSVELAEAPNSVSQIPLQAESHNDYDFDRAIVEAETNPLVLVGIVKAMYAKMKGDFKQVEVIAEEFKNYMIWKEAEAQKVEATSEAPISKNQ